MARNNKNNSPHAPRYLGRQTTGPTKSLDRIPWKGDYTVVRLHCSEFTSHCPVTSQPDFARLEITYVPHQHLVETKSLKMYLWSFRDRKAFNEALVKEITETFFRVVKPRSVAITGYFNARGGISVECSHSISSGRI